MDAQEVELPKTTVSEPLDTNVSSPPIDRKNQFLLGWGGLAGEIGRGREKTARLVGTDKVLISYHGEINQRLATPDYMKAQFYMHKILHELLPNNFPDVFAAGDGSLLVERIPDTEDLVKAREILTLYLDPKKNHLITTKQRDWLQQKTEEIKKNQEFQRAIAIMRAIGLGYGKDENPDDLAQPVNTVMVNGHPVLLEMMKPIVTNAQSHTILRMNIDALTEVVRQGVEEKYLDEKKQNQILSYVVQYQENAKKAAETAIKENITVY